MTASNRNEFPVQTSLADHFAKYLQKQASAHAAGFAGTETAGEVVPHEAGPAQPVDPRLAWDGAVAALSFFDPKTASKLPKPADWASLVAMHESAAGLAFAAGNFPQLVRSLQPLLQAKDLASLRPSQTEPLHAPALTDWARKTADGNSLPQSLLALGILRLARQFDEASRLLAELKAIVPSAWENALANEEAALAWHAGRADDALRMWNSQPESVPVLFNRGMAALFTGKATEARAALSKAVNQLPEDGAWHHLGRLYLALAEARVG